MNPRSADFDDGDLVAAYEHMRSVARRRLHSVGPQSIQATDLVNDAYLRLHDRGHVPESRSDLIRLTAWAMRDVLVDRAREKSAQKRGSDWTRVNWESAATVAAHHPDEFLVLDRALQKLQQELPDLADVVQLKFYAGLTGDETAQVLGVSPTTVDRRWTAARAWLHRQVVED